jgi:hypothetical protein
VSDLEEAAQAASQAVQDEQLDKAAHAEERSTRQPRRARRPSIQRDELRRWKAALEVINVYRAHLSELLTKVAAHGTQHGRSFPGNLDRVATEALRDWADDPDTLATPPARPTHWWWLCFLGALIALAKRGAEPIGAAHDLTMFDPIHEAADRFLDAWAPHRVFTFLESELEAQMLAVALTALLHDRADARGRLRRCQYTRCDRLFYDASPTYRSNPAKGCRPTHKDLATRQQRRSRAR